MTRTNKLDLAYNQTVESNGLKISVDNEGNFEINGTNTEKLYLNVSDLSFQSKEFFDYKDVELSNYNLIFESNNTNILAYVGYNKNGTNGSGYIYITGTNFYENLKQISTILIIKPTEYNETKIKLSLEKVEE